MKLADHLRKEQRRKLNSMVKKNSPSLRVGGKIPKSNPLSERELKELMGVNRDTYKRVNGRIRNK